MVVLLDFNVLFFLFIFLVFHFVGHESGDVNVSIGLLICLFCFFLILSV